MKKLLCFTLTALLISVSLSFATDYSSPYTDPSGTCGQTTYSELDVFGDIIGTIPTTSPGANNAWVGMAWANGELIEFKNIYPNTVPSQFLRINPATGAVIATVNFPFNGYVMGGTFDGTNLWVAQWSPTNVIWCVSLTGTAVSSFIPVTGAGYSARCPNWDGQYLWVGCNLSSANTKLIKMTTTGTNVQEWMTGSAVGWYMGGEFDANAPAGANLYVVDNVGNTIKRLNLGTTVTVAAQVGSPAAPDYAEGLTFDGEYLWHCGANATQGVIWQLDDGFPSGPPPNITISMTPVLPPIVIPAGGGSFDYTAVITNNETTAQTFQVWVMVTLPGGSQYGPVLGPLSVTLPASTALTRVRTQSVPASAPAGAYTYTGNVGSYPGTVYNSSSFPFTKSALAGGNVSEWLNTGDAFVPETVELTNYPNPFNPATTINFSLPVSGFTSLTVYDLSGRQVAQLVNGYREVGSHQVTFDASALASGVYLYRLNSAGQTSIAKMVLTK